MGSHDVTFPGIAGSEVSNLIQLGAREELQVERQVQEIVDDMAMLCIPVDVLRRIALGHFNPHEFSDDLVLRPGQAAVIVWAHTKLGQQAAAKRLAEEDSWNLKVAVKHAKTGYQRLLTHPILRNITVDYEGGPFGGLAEKRFDFLGLRKTINEMTLGDFRNISLGFLRMVLPGSEFAKENKAIAGFSCMYLSERKDLLSKGMNQLDKERRKLLKKIIASGEKQQKARRI